MNSFTVYTQDGCIFCTRAIELLQSKNQAVNVINVNADPETKHLFHRRGFKTVPQIYHNGKQKHLGYFSSAAAAYLARQHFLTKNTNLEFAPNHGH